MNWQEINSIILGVTFLSILWYSWETRQLRKVTSNQMELSLRPLIVILYDEGPSKFFLKNIGNGPAFKIIIKDIPIIKENKELYITYVFDRKNYLRPDERLEISGDIKFNETPTDGLFFMSHFYPHSAIRSFRYSITYTNMIGKEYTTHGYIGKDGIKIE